MESIARDASARCPESDRQRSGQNDVDEGRFSTREQFLEAGAQTVRRYETVQQIRQNAHADRREGAGESGQGSSDVCEKKSPYDRRYEVDEERAAGDRGLKARGHEGAASGEQVRDGVERLQGGTTSVTEPHEGPGRRGARDDAEADPVSKTI